MPNAKRKMGKGRPKLTWTHIIAKNEETRVGERGLGRQRWMESSVTFLKWIQEDVQDIVLYFIVLYCIEGVVIAAHCTASFSRSNVLP